MKLFEKLNSISVGEHIEKKGKLSYLSWAWAWTTISINAENVKQNVYEDLNGNNYHNDGKTAWVKVGIEAEAVEHIEYLPIMDYNNKSIALSVLTSMDVNKAIQRAGTKAIARHGLGLYIYAGEDLPGAEPIKLINQEQVLEIVKLIAKASTTLEPLMKKLNWGIVRLEDIQEINFQYVVDLLNDIKQQNQQSIKQYSINDIRELAKIKDDFDLGLIEKAYGKNLAQFDLTELNKAYKTLQGK